MKHNEVSKYLPLTHTTYYILISLISPLHGYGIMQKVEEISGGEIKLGPGTLYGALSKLEKQGIITKIDEVDEERRKSYVLTTLGTELVKLEFLRIKKLIEVSTSIVNKLEVDQNDKI
ncbi:PadR family transcriptional regulator [Bacillus salitolerans]|uniref:PadR family transcriptional regulator n=1 Tax=Bacillus salitolerans TaxID=1437434 RepID=A0ABW4LT34_9BACI